MQGTVLFRARLPLERDSSLPHNDTHLYIGDGQFGLYYPISHGHCVWTIGVPEATLAEAGVPAKPARISTDSFHGDAESLAQQRAEAGKVILQVCFLPANDLSWT